MLPLELFRSRQFASATVLALVAYAALGGVIFLFVAFLQITLGYTALQAGAATLPITALMLILSRPSGAIAQRIGPRIPLAIGAVLTGAGLLLMAQIRVGDRYLTGVLPSLVVFGAGLAALITPITATVLASVGSRHSGIASAVNNAFSRLGQMVAVAALPLAAGLSGAAFENPARMAAGFPVAMTIAAGTSFAAALLAWTTISDNALSRPEADTEPAAKDLPPSVQRHCAVAGTPLAAPPGPRPSSRPPTVRSRDPRAAERILRPVRRLPGQEGAPPASPGHQNTQIGAASVAVRVAPRPRSRADRARSPAPSMTQRYEFFIRAHIYALIGIRTHGAVTLRFEK